MKVEDLFTEKFGEHDAYKEIIHAHTAKDMIEFGNDCIKERNAIKNAYVKDIESRVEIGYTMAVYGNRDAIHDQMSHDIEQLLKLLK